MISVLLGSLIISRRIQPPGPLLPLDLQIKRGQTAFTAFIRNVPWLVTDHHNLLWKILGIRGIRIRRYKGIRITTRLCVGMSYLCEHKFMHNFQDCLNSIYSGGLDTKSTSHFLLHCPTFNDDQYALLSILNKID